MVCAHVYRPYVMRFIVTFRGHFHSLSVNDADSKIFMYHFLGTCNCLYSFLLFLWNETKEGTHISFFVFFFSFYKSIENSSSGLFLWFVCFRKSLAPWYIQKHKKKLNKNKCLICTSQSLPKDNSRPGTHSFSLSLSICPSLCVCASHWCACHFKRKCRQTSR